MSDRTFNMKFRPPMSLSEGGYPGFNPRTEKAKGMVIERDVAVTMRDGVKIYIDILRPEREGEYPILVNWGPYGKFCRLKYDIRGNCGIDDDELNEYTAFEAGDAVYWCRNGYALINPDPRGTWNSEGRATFMTDQEAEDCYDLIEWAGVQPWSNGKVGMQGVSYLAWSQWKVASFNPPHLAAINPWEGVSDFYREMAYHGGIPETHFRSLFQSNVSFSLSPVEDYETMAKEHPLFDEYWEGKNADLTKIKVPAFVVASWSDHGLHNRGTIEGFRKMASEEKWLLIHGRKKWWHFYQKENVEMQRQFFNRFLKGIDNRVNEWPKITLEVRERIFVGSSRTEREWPPARTEYTKLYLDAHRGTLSLFPVEKTASARYGVDDITDKAAHAALDFEFDKKTELTGYMKLKLWVEACGSDDMDLFVAIEKIDKAGYRVPFVFFGNHDDGPVALGWLRVSHRELDEERSTPYQPVHVHRRLLKLKPDQVVPVEIEIWPSSTLFHQGEKLRVVVKGSDIHAYSVERHTNQHKETVNRGDHIIHTGGPYDSHLLVPVIPGN